MSLTETPESILAGPYSSDDLHKRREGEALGYVPNVGDRIRYAMRHDRWDGETGKPVEDWPVHTARGRWSEPCIVLSAYERPGNNFETYALRNAGNGDRSWIDLEWWICEQIVEDGALW